MFWTVTQSFFKDVHLQCISQHGCTSGPSLSQRRCKQSCHGKKQPGSFHLNAKKGQNWNSAEILMTVQVSSAAEWMPRVFMDLRCWYFTWRKLDIGNDLIAIRVHRHKIVGVSIQHKPSTDITQWQQCHVWRYTWALSSCERLDILCQ